MQKRKQWQKAANDALTNAHVIMLSGERAKQQVAAVLKTEGCVIRKGVLTQLEKSLAKA